LQPRFINTRDLKNRTNEVLREAEEGYTVVVTRRGKPVVTVRSFDTEGLTVLPGKKPYTRLFVELRSLCTYLLR